MLNYFVSKKTEEKTNKMTREEAIKFIEQNKGEKCFVTGPLYWISDKKKKNKKITLTMSE